MNKTYVINLLLLIGINLYSVSTLAQDSIPASESYNLPEFSISEKLDKMLSKINTHEIDSSVLAYHNTNNISTLLSKNSAVTIRSYGATGLSSVSMRGGNANHTAVLWNGFNLQDPLNGGVNFASSSTSFIDEVNIQYGGSSTVFGSGAIGGTIHLNNIPVFNNRLYGSVFYKTGSFGLNSANLEIGHGTKKIATRFRLFGNTTNNDFEFQNTAKIGQPNETYNNAIMKQYGVLHEFYFKIKPDQIISSQFWYQHNFREIPPNITSESITNTEENQTDNWYRWSLNWNKKGDVINYEARTGNFYSKSNYINSTLDLNSNNNSFRNITEVLAIAKILKNHKITFGINNNYTIGLSDNFNENPSLNTTAIYLAPSFIFSDKLTINTSLREEYYNEEFKPVTYGINSKYVFYKNLYLTASFSKNYRTPNFNDLFWGGGSARGNINLKDEHGYSKDIGLGVRSQSGKLTLESGVSFYHNIINNQIQWIPEGQIWTPQNIKKVESIGVELTTSLYYQFNKDLKLNFNLNYSYTDARTKEKSEDESEEILDKQLIYIPYYQGNTFIGLTYKNISFSTALQYVGYQFTRADNLTWIDAYLLTDIGSEYKITGKKQDIFLFGKINNVFNTVYEVRQWYPMPKLNYEIGFKLTIK